MGKRTSTANEEGKTILAGNFAATGQSGNTAVNNLGANMTGVAPLGKFNVALFGVFVGTVTLEKSFDGGANWVPVFTAPGGAAISMTVPQAFMLEEPEAGVIYRFNCTAYTSGTINYRLSQ